MEKILLTVEHWLKRINQNSTSIHDKNSEQSEYGGNIHKHRKGHI